MLETLSIKNFIIVEQLDLEFQSGFTTLTGETGAGKSILIDALSLALGARNEGDVIRVGCEKAEISASFLIANNDIAQYWLAENEIDAADGLILRRVIYVDGRSRCFINGISATVTQLKHIGGMLVDIYSQNAHHSLLNSNTQRQILDEFSSNSQLADRVSVQFKQWHQLHCQQLEIENNLAAYIDELAELRDKTRELEQLQFSEQEWQELQDEHSRLSNGAALLGGVEGSVRLLREAEPAALSILTQAQAKLTEVVVYDTQLNEVSNALDSAVIQIEDATRTLSHYLQRADLDPAKLNEVEARIQDIHNTSRKYRLNPQELNEALSAWKKRQNDLESFANDGVLAKQVTEAHEAYLKLAKELGDKRKLAANALSEEISLEMQRLSLSGGKFEVKLHTCEAAAYGLEQVEFLVAGHAGVEPKPLSKVASGGELSRISLALHVTTAAKGGVPCMIFDEVDVGIGGGVAEVVGQLLKQLGNNQQVLVITHLAQVAAQATQHLQVSKMQVHEVTLSHIQLLNSAERIEEIARMSGGLVVTDATLRHAKEMLGF